MIVLISYTTNQFLIGGFFSTTSFLLRRLQTRFETDKAPVKKDERRKPASQLMDHMKALIIYDDITCAANTTAILHRMAHHADVTVKWEIRPWRLNMLKSPPTAKQALGDAVDAHLIVFAVRTTPNFPVWTMDWLEQWAVLRTTPDAALAIIGDGTPKASAAQATAELSRFARRYGLSFIFNNHGGNGDKPALIDPRVKEGESRLFPARPPFSNVSKREANDAWDLNN
jgi:hypothetical protein